MEDEDWDNEITDNDNSRGGGRGALSAFQPSFEKLGSLSAGANETSCSFRQSVKPTGKVSTENAAPWGRRFGGVHGKSNGEDRPTGGFGSGGTFGNRATPGNKFEEMKYSGFVRDVDDEDSQSNRVVPRRGGMSGGGAHRGGRGSSRGGFGRFTNDENEKQDGRQNFGGFGSKRGGFGASAGDSENRGKGGRGGYKGSNEEVIAGSGRSMWKQDGDAEGGDRAGPKVTYVPPPPPDDEDAIFAHYQTGINFDKYDDILVDVSGLDPPPAILTFEEANLCPTLMKNIARAGYFKLTPVQKHSIPIVMAGRDLMACAQTGSGKTAAFLIPILAHMMQDGAAASQFEQQQLPECIIVAPTRELINQIFLESRKFAHGTCIKSVVTYGGTQTGYSIRQIMQGCNILCATPGRLLDFIGREKIGLNKLKYLVLDEADRMLDMGFGPAMKKLISSPGMPPNDKRQTLMFSATFPEEIQRLAGEFLKAEYLFVVVGQVGGACSDVQQTILQVNQYDKREKLVEILNGTEPEKTIVGDTGQHEQILRTCYWEYPVIQIFWSAVCNTVTEVLENLIPLDTKTLLLETQIVSILHKYTVDHLNEAYIPLVVHGPHFGNFSSESKGDKRTMVFVETKKKADFIATFLCQENIATTSIHGDREQREREEALYCFRSGKCPVLVATSVAARGLDIENVQHVINFDLPSMIDEYVHRIGRTGRCGNIGKATSFFDPHSDSAIAQPLVKILADAQQEVPAWLEEIACSAGGMSFSNSRGSMFASVDSRKVYRGKENQHSGGGGFAASNISAADESWD